MHIMYLEDGKIRQCSKVSSVPDGVEYWHVTATEKEFMDANRDKREAWTWTASRAADGVGGTA